MGFDLAKNLKISPEILKLIAEIDEFKGQWSAISTLTPERLHQLKRVATIESVGSSTRIEGAQLSDSEVEQLLSGVARYSFKSRDEEEVTGYAETMNIIFDSFQEISLTENYIKQLHGILLKYSSKDIRHRGEYKKLPNHVEAYDSSGKSLGVVFQTASPFDTPFRMKELVEWTLTAIQEDSLHSLLIISLFILHFLAIHPFRDGNGRLSRIVTTYLLLKSGYVYVPFASLEKIIEENKDKYYLALRKSQSRLHDHKEDPSFWILFFLKSLMSQKNVLIQKINDEEKLTDFSELDRQIIRLIQERETITNRYVQRLTQANANTIKSHLKKLTSQGIIEHHGKGKGSYYSILLKQLAKTK